MEITIVHRLVRTLDPRRSLASAIGWLVLALSIGLALVASAWVDDIVHTNLLDQRKGQLASAADRIAARLNLNLALRLQSVRAMAALLATELRDENQATIGRNIANLQKTSPEFEWIGVANAEGRVLAATRGAAGATNVRDRSWFALGLKGARIGDVQRAAAEATTPTEAAERTSGSFVELAAPVIDAGGVTVGVIGTQLSKRWLLEITGSLGDELRGEAGSAILLLDQYGKVLIGPASVNGQRWRTTDGTTVAAAAAPAVNRPGSGPPSEARVEELGDGRLYLVAQAAPGPADALRALGWRVAALQPLQDATQRARILQLQIAAVLLGLGLLAALLGVLLARRVTRDLGAIARSADAIRSGATERIAVPSGRDEAARLGRALDELLASLQRERSELRALNAELDQRVAARTREIERLAGEARYAAVVRERLKIARDLHDTLAHSMMAMLTEIRLLKRLATGNPGAMAEELMRAEETAHQGLKEARAAIAQMRFNPVRDAGLAAALGELVKRFADRTGIPVDYTSDAPAGAYADAWAETIFRIAEEALHNVERHAGATRVAVSLRAPGAGHGLTLTISDDGGGFDAEAAHPGHYGLAGLREQAQLIGAVLTIQSAPRQGTTISVALAPELDS